MRRKLFAMVFAIASTAFSDTESAMAERARVALLALPLSFEVNQGQTASDVKFLARGDGYALFLTADSAVFKLRLSASEAVIRMRLAGALCGKVKIGGAERLPGKANYFIGNDPSRWTLGAKTYKKVNYEQVYRGIDLVYYGTQHQLEYDFVVAPGADPNQLVLEIDGATPKLTESGDLELTAVDGQQLRLHQPVVYQTKDAAKEPVAASYRLAGCVAGASGDGELEGLNKGEIGACRRV